MPKRTRTKTLRPRSSGPAPRAPAAERCSPEDIIEALSKVRAPSSWSGLSEALGVDGPRDERALARNLDKMERTGQVVRNRRGQYGLAQKMDLVPGRVQAHRDSFGFLIPDNGESDLYLSQRQMRALLNGDRIVARVVGVDSRGRREGAVVEVLERSNTQIVGRFWQETGVAFVRPDHVRIHQDVLVPPGQEGSATHGEMVVVRITEQPTKHHQPVGEVEEVLGDRLAPGMEIDIALRAYDIPHEFPKAVLTAAKRCGREVPAALRDDRVDLRDLPLVTIDGLDAKDFDDAVHCAPTRSGWRLTVAIADVSSYVPPGSALDQEALRRGTSVYFPERVVPMLPEALSNGLCSLRPDEDRLCLVCEMLVARDGSITRSRFFAGLMRSHARLTYDEVAKVLVDRDAQTRARLSALVPHLEALYAAYDALRIGREERGALELDSTDSRFVFNLDGKVSQIVPVTRNDAHRIIEECMISANVATARFLERHRMPALFRVHDRPSPDKLSDLRALVGELGLKLDGGDNPSPKDYTALIAACAGRPESPIVQMAVLRSMKQAVYTPANLGHFGLALERYMHFTSPIRRYPDLLVHRAIKHVLAKAKRDTYPYDGAQMLMLGERTSMTERRAEDATRDVVHRLKCEFMLDRVGEDFDGVVSGVTAFGLFVSLEGIDVSGLVHISALGRDYFHFDSAANQLSGENTGTVYRCGDRLPVRVVRVDIDSRKIDLEPQEPSGGPPRRPHGNRGGPKDQRRGPGGRKSQRSRR